MEEKKRTKQQTPMRVIQGGKYPTTEKYIETAWQFARSALWQDRRLSTKEITQCKKLVEEYILSKSTPENGTQCFIECVTLTAIFIQRKPGRYAAHPLEWLNRNFCYGIKVAEDWLRDVYFQRRTVPTYKIPITYLSEGILKYFNNPGFHAYTTCSRKLTGQGEYMLMQLLNNTIITINFLSE
jgi:hypothetical protein